MQFPETFDIVSMFIIMGFFGSIGSAFGKVAKGIGKVVKKAGGVVADVLPFGGVVKTGVKYIGQGLNAVGAFGRNKTKALSGTIRSGETDFSFGQGIFEVAKKNQRVFSLGVEQTEQGENAGYGQSSPFLKGGGTPLLAENNILIIFAIAAFFLLKGK